MITRADQYEFVTVTVPLTGNVLPLRSGASRRILNPEDAAFVFEAAQERAGAYDRAVNSAGAATVADVPVHLDDLGGLSRAVSVTPFVGAVGSIRGLLYSLPTTPGQHYAVTAIPTRTADNVISVDATSRAWTDFCPPLAANAIKCDALDFVAGEPIGGDAALDLYDDIRSTMKFALPFSTNAPTGVNEWETDEQNVKVETNRGGTANIGIYLGRYYRAESDTADSSGNYGYTSYEGWRVLPTWADDVLCTITCRRGTTARFFMLLSVVAAGKDLYASEESSATRYVLVEFDGSASGNVTTFHFPKGRTWIEKVIEAAGFTLLPYRVLPAKPDSWTGRYHYEHQDVTISGNSGFFALSLNDRTKWWTT